jgi:hypothetical protein
MPDTPQDAVLYVYRCAQCGHRGQVHLAGDSHDGAPQPCEGCGAAVTLEWDGGVRFDGLRPALPVTPSDKPRSTLARNAPLGSLRIK